MSEPTKTGQEEESAKQSSLASSYRTSTGFLQSLSLIANAALMIYAHVGLSAVFVSNQRQIGEAVATTGAAPADESSFDLACSESDQQRWTSVGVNGLTGADNKTFESTFCSTGYTDPDTQSLCLTDASCVSKCFSTQFNYTESCADCFAAIPSCSLSDGCFVCSFEPQSEACFLCTLRCNQVFQNCSGLSIDLISRPWEEGDTGTNTTNDEAPEDKQDEGESFASNKETCEAQKKGVDFEDTKTYFTVFEVLFFESMEIAWNNDARLLAFVVVAFSFVWPYTKNIILMFAWYMPLSERSRSQVLLWLRRLGKYTLTDVYVILILIVGMVLELNLNGVPVIARGEPRPAIIAFLVATLWEFVHIEWMTLFHHRKVVHHSDTQPVQNLDNLAYAIRFNSGDSYKEFKNPMILRALLGILLLMAIVLLAVGSTIDLVRFTTTLEGQGNGCVRAYSLFTFASIALSDLVLHENGAVPGIWTLVISFTLFVQLIPWCVHIVHAMAIWFGLKSRTLFRFADGCWTFSCVEVFLISLYVLEYKFSSLVDRLAGDEGAALFGVTSELGPGFFVLIAYTICGGFVHYFFSNGVSELFTVDPHHKIDSIWTLVFGPFLKEVDGDAPVAEDAQEPIQGAIGRSNIAEEDVI